MYKLFLIRVLALIILSFFVYINAFSQRQNNTVGSSYYADTPYRIIRNANQSLPIAFYFHNNNCTGCSGDLAYIDIYIKPSNHAEFTDMICFGDFSDDNFLGLFSSKSLKDTVWGSQSFDEGIPVKDIEHTITFAADTNWGLSSVPNVPLVERYFYFTFNVPDSIWEVYADNNGVFDLKIRFGIDWETDQYVNLRIFTKEHEFPKLENWYRGDTHYHTMFTQNSAENGLPIEQTVEAMNYLGMDWIAFTDHSCDFDNYGESMQENWNKLGSIIADFNSNFQNIKLIRGVEMSIKNSNNKVVHALVYPSADSVFSMPFIGDGGGDLSSTDINIDMMLDSLEKYDGFCYAAHPYAEYDKLSSIISGGLWNYGHNSFPENEENFPSFGTVSCNDLSIESDIFANNEDYLIKNRIIGGQVWNLWNSLYTTSNVISDPFNVTSQNSNSLYNLLASEPESHLYRLSQNLDVYKHILKRGLISKNLNPEMQNWKHFLIGGSDAHGSFNYSTTDLFGWGITGNITDNAMGRIATLVYCSNGMGENGENVLNALKNGNSIMSSGPILANYLTENAEMLAKSGEDIEIFYNQLENTDLKLELSTNNEFGETASIHAIIGTENNEYYFTISNFDEMNHYSLLDILNSLSINEEEFLDKYIYLRTEYTSIKQYSQDLRDIYLKDYDIFHSYSNPIWIKVNNDINDRKELLNDNFYVYPNPCTNKLYIACNETIDKIQIFDLKSVLIYEENSRMTSEVLLDINSLKQGTYLLKIWNNNNCYYKRIVKI
jgi:hypothetical protein